MDIKILFDAKEKVVRSDLHVHGTASHSQGLAIHNITAGGVPAKKDSFNFSAWSVTLPFSTLESLSRNESGDVLVPVTAVDTCGTTAATSFAVHLGIPVKVLTLKPPEYPLNETYIPANGSYPAFLTVTANPEAVGARVKLDISDGATITGLVDGEVVLAGDGNSDAKATALVSGTKQGTVFITARAEDKTANAVTVRVAGPPSIIPASDTLAPKESVTVTVTSEGRIASCQATPAEGVTVTSGGKDLMAAPAAVDDNNDGKVDITIAAADNLVDMVMVTVTCVDPFGQASTGTFTAQP
jgi:hypothetical protein